MNMCFGYKREVVSLSHQASSTTANFAFLCTATLTFLNDYVQRYNATPGQDFTVNACATNFGNANIGSGRMVTVNWTKDGELLDVENRPDYSFNDVTDELTISTYDAFEDNGTYSCVVTYEGDMLGKRRKRATMTLSRSFVVSIDGK